MSSPEDVQQQMLRFMQTVESSIADLRSEVTTLRDAQSVRTAQQTPVPPDDDLTSPLRNRTTTNPPTTTNSFFSLWNDRAFQNPDKFSGQKKDWTEWIFWFRPTLAKASRTADRLLEGILANPNREVTMDQVEEHSDEAAELAVYLYQTLCQLCKGEARPYLENTRNKNGFEAFRRLSQYYQPSNHHTGIAILNAAQRPTRVTNIAKLPEAIERWERDVRRAKDEFNEPMTDFAKVGALMQLCPKDAEIYLTMHQTEIPTYPLAKARLLNWIQAREGVGALPMDIGRLGVEGAGVDEEQIGAITWETICKRCGGRGHFARECPTPQHLVPGAKGKGKGGKSPCPHCGRTGHDPKVCWKVRPDLKESFLKEKEKAKKDSMDVGAVEKPIAWVEEDLLAHIGRAEDEAVIAAVGTSTRKRFCGMDSCAGESVTPPNIWAAPTMPSALTEQGVHYRSATGERIPNKGQVIPTLQFKNGPEMRATFQECDVDKLLMSVGKTVDQGHSVHFTPKGSWVDFRSGKSMELERRGNIFGVEVEEVIPTAAASASSSTTVAVIAPIVPEAPVFSRPTQRWL